MNILYLHGFGSRYTEENPKIGILNRIGNVQGFDVDYTNPWDDLVEWTTARALLRNIDLVVGTSMGGWLASHVGESLGIPFVALNPAVEPSKTLLPSVGTREDYFGREYTLTEEAVKSFPDFKTGGCGMILVELDDEIIDAEHTYKKLKDSYFVMAIPGGSHQFDSLHIQLDLIENFYEDAGLVYGN